MCFCFCFVLLRAHGMSIRRGRKNKTECARCKQNRRYAEIVCVCLCIVAAIRQTNTNTLRRPIVDYSRCMYNVYCISVKPIDLMTPKAILLRTHAMQRFSLSLSTTIELNWIELFLLWFVSLPHYRCCTRFSLFSVVSLCLCICAIKLYIYTIHTCMYICTCESIAVRHIRRNISK